ncbi:alpha/beta hydrolase [Flavihumibacter petaseus]|uniref:Putative hydrolase n=1 Tax=Flavihumibacter petaseus NBRC 106054 TaxID=1220578 RepID=A0A0E9N669_9BACT|nr:alpha/beta hydrolase [Flavihumibacter petaseus]GAO45417.1 putative hydrolase [Flavihumibacter petaseus NBRC 106054]
MTTSSLVAGKLFLVLFVSTVLQLNAQKMNYLTDPHLSVGTKQFLKLLNTGGPPVESLPVPDARKVLENAQASVNVDLSGVDFTGRTIETEGYRIVLDIVKPSGSKEMLPVFMFIHGGGWVLGDFPTHRRLVRDLVTASGFAAVFVNYTRTPDARYPRAIHEIYAATKWVSQHGDEIGVDGSRLAVVGNSVGGNMTAVTAMMAKAHGGPEIKLQIMMWPIVDAQFNTTSYKLYGEQRFLTTSLMKWMYDLYTTDPKERKEVYASPLQASIEQLRGLPPALIQVAENDILRDEGEAYGRKLDEAGVTVSTVRYNGVIHDFGMLNGMADLPQTHSLILHAAAELKKYLR